MNQNLKKTFFSRIVHSIALTLAVCGWLSLAHAEAPSKKVVPSKSSKASKSVGARKTPTAPKKVKASDKKAQKLKQSFAPVELNKKKQSAGWDQPYLLAAYGVVWLLLLFYFLGLAKRMGSTDKQLKQIERRLSVLEGEDA